MIRDLTEIAVGMDSPPGISGPRRDAQAKERAIERLLDLLR